MVDLKSLLRVTTIAQSAKLVDDSVKLAIKKNVKSKDLVKTGVKTITGSSLIKAESELIGGI